MTTDSHNPLTPLHSVRLSSEDKEQMWNHIIESVELEQGPSREREREPRRGPKGHRDQDFKTVMAGIAAVILAVGGLMTLWHQWGNKPTTAEKHHVVKPPVNETPPSSSVTPSHVTGIHMTNAKDGWITQVPDGATLQLLRTTDGGKTWQDVTPKVKSIGGVEISKLNPNNQNEFTEAFPSANHAVLAWAVPRGTSGNQLISDNILIETTTDGGKTWSVSEIKDNLGPSFGQKSVSFDFINDKDGWLTTMPTDGGGVMFIREALYKTMDGGVHWTKVSQTNLSKAGTLPSTNASPEEGWVSFINPNVGFTLSEPPTQTDMLNSAKPSVYRTTNGGATWSPVNIPTFPQPFHVTTNRVLPPQAFGRDVILPVVTETANPNSYTLRVYVSHDKGLHFTQEKGTASMQQSTQASIQYGFWDAKHGWFFIGGSLYTTNDGGQTISKVKSNHDFSQIYNTISWLNQNTAMVAGDSGVWKTTDGGRNWVAVEG